MDGKRLLRSPMSRTKVIAFSLLPTLLLLGAGELGLRVWAYYFRTSYERFNYRTGRLELVPSTYIPGPGGTAIQINSRGFVGPEFEMPKPKSTFRIIAVGDSCTFGTGEPRYTFPHMLERHLNSSMGLERIEVINAGIEGYNSEFALARLKDELLGYDPDMIIIYIGWNDLMKLNPEYVSVAAKHSWLANLLQRSYLAKAYNKLLFYYLRPLVAQPSIDRDETEAHAYDQFVPRAFKANIEGMVQLMRGRHVMPLLVTLPTVVRPGLTYADLKRLNVFFPYYAGTYSVGKFLSLHRSYNNTIRAVAGANEVPLVDLDTVFNQHDKDELFWDTMHPSLRGQQMIADWLAGVVHQSISNPPKHNDRHIGDQTAQVGRRSSNFVD